MAEDKYYLDIYYIWYIKYEYKAAVKVVYQNNEHEGSDMAISKTGSCSW